MRVLENVEPQEVMFFFEELSRRYRGSRNEKQATDYVADFAEKRGLEHHREEARLARL